MSFPGSVFNLVIQSCLQQFFLLLSMLFCGYHILPGYLMLQNISSDKIQFFNSWVCILLTNGHCRMHFVDTNYTNKTILSNMNIPTQGYGFHTFQRSGAPFVFANNISLQNIIAHGSWKVLPFRHTFKTLPLPLYHSFHFCAFASLPFKLGLVFSKFCSITLYNHCLLY